jgi:hypothetical protein
MKYSCRPGGKILRTLSLPPAAEKYGKIQVLDSDGQQSWSSLVRQSKSYTYIGLKVLPSEKRGRLKVVSIDRFRFKLLYCIQITETPLLSGLDLSKDEACNRFV